MRGAMMFEDFNYRLFNKYILIDQDHRDYEHLNNDEYKTIETEGIEFSKTYETIKHNDTPLFQIENGNLVV